ncbi:MAG: hypothetical protein JGK30_26000 [Microcoleus sp. PH2017_40_RAT_O_B]|uniref:hypothetical protein n=1 Tax=unclassified Microcoleus TaxID=2642155 RepID=UPI001E00370A|nr:MULTISPECIES: hypothetical protein [unclassified Microcoleus]MCC3575251.1 hypothetical protein [Microcoleus sp. PH2017_34_RAT_O_A]MCC3612829.1 hypothetical protein [Microcoleus sp. PH2017_40_RAT_O_B]
MMLELFKNGLLIGFVVNLVFVILLAVYVLLVEIYLTRLPDPLFQLPLKLATVVDSRRLFGRDFPSEYIRGSWSHIQSYFSFFVVEYQLSPNYRPNSSRLLNWCKQNQCVAHRMGYYDIRKNEFNIFTIDDWYTNNIYQNLQDVSSQQKHLDIFLKSLNKDSIIILSEPFSTFDRPQSLKKFLEWALTLRLNNPHLKFQIGIQIHLQWVDAFWLKNWWILPELSKFSKTQDFPWMVSEFSNYDRIWKRRLRVHNPKEQIFYKIESLVPQRLRRAVMLCGVYLIHRDAVKYGAVSFVEWGNYQETAWFVDRVDADYQSNYQLFNRDGLPTATWWAVMRGLSDGSP